MSRAVLIVVLVFSAFSAGAKNITVKSGIEKNQFIELYTSEGCSSCPPADKWLSDLKQSELLWKDIVPVAFHVDYWDQLGWKDELADGTFSDRQRRYRREGAISQVYTPGFIVDGKEWRGFFKRKTLKHPVPLQVGEVSLEIKSGQIIAEFTPLIATGDNLIFHVALLGFEIANEILAGENAGKMLFHDFAVLAYENKNVARRNNAFMAEMPLPGAGSLLGARRTAIVVWVSESNSQAPLQAVGYWL